MNTYTLKVTRIFVYIYTHQRIHKRTHAHAQTRTHAHTNMHTHMYIHIHKRTRTHTFTHTHIDTYTYSQTHEYVHKHTPTSHCPVLIISFTNRASPLPPPLSNCMLTSGMRACNTRKCCSARIRVGARNAT
jgi:deoxyribodipyrimidine photolyase